MAATAWCCERLLGCWHPCRPSRFDAKSASLASHYLPCCHREAHGATLHHWRWRGLLTDYLAAEGAPAGSTRPAILLTHGFGAFSGAVAGCFGAA